MHWLMALRRKVDDRQAPVREADAGIRIEPDTFVVRAAMPDCSAHGAEQVRFDPAG
jgi:hypothetical protein